MTRFGLWQGHDQISHRSLTRAKVMLIAIIVVTSLLPLAFVRPDDAPWHINVFKYLAKTGAFVGGMLLLWQFFLGFRGAVSRVLPDLSFVVDLHKALGTFGVPIIVLHPIFIGLYYAQHRDENIFALDLGEPFSLFVLLGMVALALIAFVVITSTLLRTRMAFATWLTTHLSAYLIPPLFLVHAFLLGPTIQGTALGGIWWFLTALLTALYLYRVAHKAGLTSSRHRVTGTRRVAEDTTEIILAPEGRAIRPALGQFIYLRHELAESSHPYTVSAHDEDSQEVGVTVAEVGEQSARLQGAQEGDVLVVDGPYGVFTRAALAWRELPIVMIAGGIGITPFRRVWQRLERDADREAHLFYGNETYPEIAYRDELDALEHVQVTHVLNDEPDHDGETGLVDVELLKRHLPRPLSDYVFLLCGPPAMIESIEEELDDAGVASERIRHELFGD